MPFQAVATQRLYEQVAKQVADLIARGEFGPGDRLPPERDLARLLGVSRPTVREAMIALEIAGLVEVRVGAGIFVTLQATVERADAAVRRIARAGPSPMELLGARLLIEPEVAARAAAMAEPEALQAIAETLEQMEAAVDTPAHRAADQLFHGRIAAATHNTVLVSLVDEIWGQMFTPLFERMGARSGLIPQARDATLDEHQAIYKAIAAGDSAGARRAMTNHLSNVERILAEGDAGDQIDPLLASAGVAR